MLGWFSEAASWASARKRRRNPASSASAPCRGQGAARRAGRRRRVRSEEHTSELQSQSNLVCRLLLEKKKNNDTHEIYFDGFTYPCSSVALGRYNLDTSIRAFAQSCFHYSLRRNSRRCRASTNTILSA